MANYEAHITMDGSQWKELKAVVDKWEAQYGIGDWKASMMLNDPVFGEGKFCYLTAHSDDQHDLAARTGSMTVFLAQAGINVRRMKIELDVWDMRIE